MRITTTLLLGASLACGSPATEVSSRSLAAAEPGACTAGCANQTDTKSASGEGTAIGTTLAGAMSTALANAEKDAEKKAAAKLRIPACVSPCVPFGLPAISYVSTSTCRPGMYGQDDPSHPDTNPADGISDYWQYACNRMSGRNINDVCTDGATSAAKPFYANCTGFSTATGVQICVDAECAKSIIEQPHAP
jgi:hypothetical protein